MVSEMLVNDIKSSIGKQIIIFIGSFRFEGKILDCDNDYLKYFDNRKQNIKYKKLSEISEFEVLE